MLTNTSVEGRKVVCIRFEDLPASCSVSYTKPKLVEEVRRTKSGKTNSFPDGPKKETAVVFGLFVRRTATSTNMMSLKKPEQLLSDDKVGEYYIHIRM